jgi:hypothetical protein
LCLKRISWSTLIRLPTTTPMHCFNGRFPYFSSHERVAAGGKPSPFPSLGKDNSTVLSKPSQNGVGVMALSPSIPLARISIFYCPLSFLSLPHQLQDTPGVRCRSIATLHPIFPLPGIPPRRERKHTIMYTLAARLYMVSPTFTRLSVDGISTCRPLFEVWFPACYFSISSWSQRAVYWPQIMNEYQSNERYFLVRSAMLSFTFFKKNCLVVLREIARTRRNLVGHRK